MRKLFATIAALVTACAMFASAPVSVIIETDMGNDIDDALALDMAYKAMDDGLIKILAVGVHKLSPTATDYVDILNTWYGYGSIPVARSLTPVYNQHQPDYTIPVCAMRDARNKPVWKRSKAAGDIEEPVALYRRLLAAQPDTSVVFLSLGFGTELVRLLESGPDAASPLSGIDLVRRKVKYLSIMAGSYGSKQRAEYNVVNDIPAMKTVFAKWPTPIVQNPFEIGPKVMYRGEKLDDQFGWARVHPVECGFRNYMKMPYNRPTWDLLSVVYITNPEMFTRSAPGTVQVNDAGYTIFTPAADGNVVWLSADTEQLKALEKHIMATTSRPPRKFKK